MAFCNYLASAPCYQPWPQPYLYGGYPTVPYPPHPYPNEMQYEPYPDTSDKSYDSKQPHAQNECKSPPMTAQNKASNAHQIILYMARLLDVAIPLTKTIEELSKDNTQIHNTLQKMSSDVRDSYQMDVQSLVEVLGTTCQRSDEILLKQINHLLTEQKTTQESIQALKQHVDVTAETTQSKIYALRQDIEKNTSECKTISEEINSIKKQISDLDESHTTLKLDIKNNIETNTTATRAMEEHADGMSLLMLSNQTNAANTLSEMEVALSQCFRDNMDRHLALSASLEMNVESIKRSVQTSMKNSINALETKLTESIKQTMEISPSLSSDADGSLVLESDTTAKECDRICSVNTVTSEVTLAANIEDMTHTPQTEPVITQVIQSIIDIALINAHQVVECDDAEVLYDIQTTETGAATIPAAVNTNENNAATNLSSTINDELENGIMDDVPVSLCDTDRGSTQTPKTKTGTHNGKAVRKRNRNKNKRRTKQTTARPEPKPKPNKPHRIALTNPTKHTESWHEDMAVRGDSGDHTYEPDSKQAKMNAWTQRRGPTRHKPRQQATNQRQSENSYRTQYDTYRTRQSTNDRQHLRYNNEAYCDTHHTKTYNKHQQQQQRSYYPVKKRNTLASRRRTEDASQHEHRRYANYHDTTSQQYDNISAYHDYHRY
eukprot:217821_1